LCGPGGSPPPCRSPPQGGGKAIVSPQCLPSFQDFAQTFTGPFSHGFERGVRTNAFGEAGAIFFAKCFHKGIAPFFTNPAVFISLTAI